MNEYLNIFVVFANTFCLDFVCRFAYLFTVLHQSKVFPFPFQCDPVRCCYNAGTCDIYFGRLRTAVP